MELGLSNNFVGVAISRKNVTKLNQTLLRVWKNGNRRNDANVEPNEQFIEPRLKDGSWNKINFATNQTMNSFRDPNSRFRKALLDISS
jgi:hypothetical protein